MLNRARIQDLTVRVVMSVGVALPAAALCSLGFSEVSFHLARLTVIAWLFDGALVFSVPWVLVATAVVVVWWRELPQRFWVLYCANGFLAYNALPLYAMHFGVHF